MRQQALAWRVTVAADASDTVIVPWPYLGTWRVDKLFFAPETAVAVGATDFVTSTITTNDSASSTDRALASHTTNTGGTALVVNTTVDLTLSAAGRTLTQGDQIKTVVDATPGSGDPLKGVYTLLATKIG